MNFEFELSKGKQNSLGETLKVVDFIKNNPKKVEHLFQCFYSENTLVAMRAMNGVKRIIKDDKKVFLKNKDRFLNQFSNKFKMSEIKILRLLIRISLTDFYVCFLRLVWFYLTDNLKSALLNLDFWDFFCWFRK